MTCCEGHVLPPVLCCVAQTTPNHVKTLEKLHLRVYSMVDIYSSQMSKLWKTRQNGRERHDSEMQRGLLRWVWEQAKGCGDVK